MLVSAASPGNHTTRSIGEVTLLAAGQRQQDDLNLSVCNLLRLLRKRRQSVAPGFMDLKDRVKATYLEYFLQIVSH